MKKTLFLLLIAGLVSSCKCQKATVENAQKHTTTSALDCPAGAKCTTEIITDSALKIEKDDTGKPYYTIVETSGTTVYRYIMAENQDQQYMDGGYREEIIFQLPSDFKNGTISGKQILETQALFGVFCYCKGKAGYYTIKEATLTKKNNQITVEVPAMVEEQKVRMVQF